MSTAEAENKPQQISQLPSRHPSAYKQVRAEIRELPCSREEIQMESNMKEQALKELDQKELEKVSGGHYFPSTPYNPDDEESGSGGATGGW